MPVGGTGPYLQLYRGRSGRQHRRRRLLNSALYRSLRLYLKVDTSSEPGIQLHLELLHLVFRRPYLVFEL